MIKKTSSNQSCGRDSECTWCVSKVPQYMIFLFEDLFTFINSVDAGEMPHYGAFYQGLHCLLKKCQNTVYNIVFNYNF